jgi:hypothetical protein
MKYSGSDAASSRTTNFFVPWLLASPPSSGVKYSYIDKEGEGDPAARRIERLAAVILGKKRILRCSWAWRYGLMLPPATASIRAFLSRFSPRNSPCRIAGPSQAPSRRDLTFELLKLRGKHRSNEVLISRRRNTLRDPPPLWAVEKQSMGLLSAKKKRLEPRSGARTGPF